LGGARHLDLCPLRHEVSQDLRFDRLPGAKLDVEFSKLDQPLDDAAVGIVVANDFS
jgi:hypothetical protein